MPLPFLMVIAPIFMGAGMYAMTRSPYTLMFVAMSPVMMIANFSQGRRSQKIRYKTQVAEHEERTLAIEEEAHQALRGRAHRPAHRRARPGRGPADGHRAAGPAVGTPARPPGLDGRAGRDGRHPERGRAARPRPRGAPGADLPGPRRTSRSRCRWSASAWSASPGPGPRPRRLARWVVAQVAALHSPADVQVVVLVDTRTDQAGGRDGSEDKTDDPAADWQFVRWLPHARADAESPVLARVGSDEQTTGRRIGELLALLESRRERAEKGAEAEDFDPVLVVLDGARELRLRNGMVTLLRQGPAHGIQFCCLDADVRLLPEECRAVVAPDPDDAGRLRVDVTGRRQHRRRATGPGLHRLVRAGRAGARPGQGRQPGGPGVQRARPPAGCSRCCGSTRPPPSGSRRCGGAAAAPRRR